VSHATAPLTLGTAGHIDHGKTALVQALTGKDTDRLPEEQARGISIELGYAQLELPGGRRVSVVDVPGHERFVRTMVAGATGIDLFLLCVAADDGVMPQTREHAAVLRQLGLEHGVVAVTKADLADPARAAAEALELAPGAEAVAVSARQGEGLEELLAALERCAAALPGRDARGGPARLHVDRSFTLRGIGTVVTGTLWSGELGAGDQVRVLPGDLRARVRSVEVHDRQVERAASGQRVALALAGLDRREVSRGDVVCGPGAGTEPTWLVDAELTLEAGARPLARGARVHVHHGTRESPARVAPLEADELAPGATALAQLRLEQPLVPLAGDRLVLRQLAPPDTIGGGVVVDAKPRKRGYGRDDSRGSTVDSEDSPPPAPPPAELDDAALRLAAFLREDGFAPRADGELAAAAGLSPAEAAARLRLLERDGLAVRVGPNLHFHSEPLGELVERVVAICERDGQATVAGVRDELGSSRRYAQALLEHLDARRVTRRQGDAHVLRRRGAAAP
jgi:selenocysteine-specific elongation factor